MNYVRTIFESLDVQKKFHLKNIQMMNNMYDKDDYVDMMKEDYIVSFHIRNTAVLKEYKKTIHSKLLTENFTSHKEEVSDFFSFLKKSALVEMKLTTPRIYNTKATEKGLLNYGSRVYNQKIQTVINSNNKKPISEQWARLKDPIGYWKGLYNQLKKAGIGVKWQVANDPAKSTFMFWGGWVIWKDMNKNGGYPISFTDKASGVNVAFRFVDYGGKYAGQAATAIKIYPKTGTDTIFNLGQFGKLSNSQMSATFKKYSKTTPKKAAPKEKSYLDQALEYGGKVVDKGTELVKKGVEFVSPYVKKVLESEFAYLVPGLQVAKLAYDAKKVYDNWEKIKKMTLEDWVEAFRNFLNGVAGIAIQIVLALTGVGNAANLIAWGLLLGYDLIYKGIIKGEWNIYNILTDCVGLIGTGAAAGAFKILKPILSGIKGLKGVGSAIAKAGPQIMSKVAPFIQKISSGIGTIIQQLTKGINWLITKIPLIGKLLTPIKSGLGKVQPYLDDLKKGFDAHFKGKVHHGKQENSLTQYMKVHKGSHFDFKSVAQKLTALGDKKLTKKIIGGATAIVYTMIAGDTLQKVVSKYQLPGLDYLKKLNPNYASLGPGKEVVVGHV